MRAKSILPILAILGGVLVAAPALAGSVFATMSTAPAIAAGADKTAAIKAVARFAPDAADTLLAQVEQGRDGGYFVVEGRGVVAHVQASTGRVATLALTDRVPQSATIGVSLADGERAALAFAERFSLDQRGVSPVVELVDHGGTPNTS